MNYLTGTVLQWHTESRLATRDLHSQHFAVRTLVSSEAKLAVRNSGKIMALQNR